MADLTLRGQCKRAMDLVRADQAAEAVAVCRRILEAFPKHIGAYSVLAQAYLVLGEQEKAANLLQRVLSVDPEHVESHISLAAICERQGLPGEALWHRQRGFELSPGNAEIRGELRRVYEERGLPVSEGVKLTRAGLARTYMRGQLYSRAACELRELLATDQERVDLRVALAETLWLDKLYEDAETVCQALLAEMPNCLKANLILGQIWLNTERDDQARALLQRAQTLDPENVTAQNMLGERSPLPLRVARVPLRDEDAPAIDLPYLEDEEDFASEHGAVPQERPTDGEPTGAEVREPEAGAEVGSGLTHQETPEDALPVATDVGVAAPDEERLRERDGRKRVEELARAIDWEGMSLIDVRRRYVEDHPDDHEAQLDLARRLRDALKLDEALKYYTRLVEEDYELLAQVTHDLYLLNRLYPRTPAVKRLFVAAQEKGRLSPRQRQ